MTPRRIRPLVDFLHAEASAGVLLVVAAFIALAWANSPWWSSYFELWGTDISVSIGSQELSLTLRDWINDLAMVLFFFVAGLEIKREVTQGELRDPKQAALPVIGFLNSGSASGREPLVAAFNRGLSETGYFDRNAVIEYRWAEGKDDRLPALAEDLCI